MLRQTVSWPDCLGIKHPSGAYDQIFITVRQLRVCWRGALSLTRGQVCRLQPLRALDSAFILASESHRTRDHILLSQIRDFPFCRLLRFAGLRWRYLTSASTRDSCFWVESSLLLRPTISRPVCLGIKHPSWAYNQFFFTVREVGCLLMWEALSDETTGSVVYNCSFTCQRILGSEWRGTRGYIFLSQIGDLLFVATYDPPPHRESSVSELC
jgi:hypothetical protein